MYIRKSTAVWLFNEGERLSSDRLIRVRDSQPFDVLTTEHVQDDDLHVAETISTGDMCVFAIDKDIKIGRVLQFAYLTEKQKKIRQCKDKTVAIKCNNEIGVLCTWFIKVPQLERVFTLQSSPSSDTHFYVTLETYICTLGKSSLMSMETVRQITNETYALTESDKVSLVSAKEMTLSETSFNYITQLLQERKQIEASHSRLPTTKNNIWVIYGKIALGKKEREAIETGKYLGDIHITMAQRLIKDQFPSIKNGLQCTLYQEKSPIGHKNALQVVHTGGNHWSLILYRRLAYM